MGASAIIRCQNVCLIIRNAQCSPYRIEVLPTPAKYHGFSHTEINKCTFVHAKPIELDPERAMKGTVFVQALKIFPRCTDLKINFVSIIKIVICNIFRDKN